MQNALNYHILHAFIYLFFLNIIQCINKHHSGSVVTAVASQWGMHLNFDPCLFSFFWTFHLPDEVKALQSTTWHVMTNLCFPQCSSLILHSSFKQKSPQTSLTLRVSQPIFLHLTCKTKSLAALICFLGSKHLFLSFLWKKEQDLFLECIQKSSQNNGCDDVNQCGKYVLVSLTRNRC